MKIPYINLKAKLKDVIDSDGAKDKTITSSKLAGSVVANVGIAVFNNRKEILNGAKEIATKVIEEGKKNKENK